MSACPPLEQLRHLLGHRLDAARCRDVERHIEGCTSCQDSLENLIEAPPAERLSACADLSAHVPPPADFIDRLKRMPPPSGSVTGRIAFDGVGRVPVSLPASVPGYEILGELGHGGMGMVFKARHVSLNRVVALKMLRGGSWQSAKDLARFRGEAEAVARLQHPNIVQIYEVGALDGAPFLSLEFVDGPSLSQKIAGVPQEPGPAARLVETLARAIHHAHEQGIVHRDLKPANVLLTSHGAPKVTDFGLAKRVEDDGSLTRAGTILGTPNYMAPEQARGETDRISALTDVYGLGAILYELLAGRPPFRAAAVLETLNQVITQEAVAPSTFRLKIPRDLETVCLKCLQKDPAKRYASALALAEDLDRFLRGEPILARPIRLPERAWRWCRRNPMVTGMATAIGALLLGLTGTATVSALRLDASRREYQSTLDRANQAEHDITEQMWHLRLSQAQAERTQNHVGRRFQSLKFIAEASAIRPSLELRNEACLCLGLPDLEVVSRWETGKALHNVLAFDSTLDRYASAVGPGEIVIHSVRDNRGLLFLSCAEKVPVWILDFSPDGRFLVGRCHPQDKPGEEIRIWDLDRPDHANSPLIVKGIYWAIHPNSRRILASQKDGSLVGYDLESGRMLKTLAGAPIPLAHALAFDPTGHTLAVANWKDPSVQLRHAETGAVLKVIPEPSLVRGLAWSSDGRLLALAGGDGRVHVWNTQSGKAQAMLRTENEQAPSIVYVTFNPEGDMLAGLGWENQLHLWNPWTGRHLGKYPSTGSVRFSPDGRLVGFASKRSVVDIGRIAGESEYALWKGDSTSEFAWSVAFHPTLGLLASTAKQRGVYLWDAATGEQVAFLATGCTQSAVFTPDGNSLVVTDNEKGLQLVPIERTPSAGKSGWRFGPPRLVFENQSLARAAISASGRTIAIVTEANVRGSLGVVRSGEHFEREVALQAGRDSHLAYVSVSPDDRWVATSTWHGAGTRVWDAATGNLVKDLGGLDAQVAFSPDSRWLVTGKPEKYEFWKLGSWELSREIARAAPSEPGPIAFQPSGQVVALCHSPFDVKLYDVATGEELATLPFSPTHKIAWLAFSGDGTQLAATGDKHLIQRWDLRAIRAGLADLRLDWDISEGRN